MTTAIYSYNSASASSKALAEALGIKRIKAVGSKFKDAAHNTVINWGSSDVPYTNARVLNSGVAIGNATNKLKFFQKMTEAGLGEWLVPFTTSQDTVRDWLDEGHIVVARQKLQGHSGEGIVLLEGGDAEIVNAPLYTQYVNKKHEFRLHVRKHGNGDCFIFDSQRKARKNDVPDDQVNWRIRNLDGGFIYAREGFETPACVYEAARQIFLATGLDFGAIDIIYNEHYNKAYVLEVNTAPGLTGTTLDKYAEAIGALI